MTSTVTQGTDPVTQVDAYLASLRAALGSRDPFEVLRTTPSELHQAIDGLSLEPLNTPERPGKWAIRDVVQHLADSELVGGYRFRMILAHERPTLTGYDQDLWASRLRYAEADAHTALEDFARLRQANLRLLERASPTERKRIGIHTERGEESIAQLIPSYAGHDIVHLRQIARIRRAVGAS